MKQKNEQVWNITGLILIKDGKLYDSQSRPPQSSGLVDASVNLKLVCKFSENDQDTFFLLFERLANMRHWSDSEKTLLL